MAQNVVLYNLLISCPGDVQGEVKLIEDAVGEFNELYTKPLGITIQTRHWSKSSYAQSGGKPQALLNEQFVSECDAAVAIFWTRFGTPTDEYGSGTEEEIEIMLQSGKQVFMYFSDKSCPPSQVDDEGYKRVRAFREKYKDKGVYFTYSTDEEFRKLFLAHLSMYFLSDKRVKDIASERCSDLKLLGIDENGKLSEDVSIYQFRPNTNITMEEYMDSIRAIYQEIAGIKVGRRTSIPAGLFLYQPADINEEEKEFITSMAKILELELPEDFFDLGNLSKNPLSSDFLTGPRLEGSADEIRKYEKIQELQETISDALKWARVEEAFSDKRCIKLAIQNCGKAIDEDVEITVEIPQKSLLTLDEFPQLINVLKGDMSLVGPRPEVRKYVDMYTAEQRRVWAVRPGITDYASIVYMDENRLLGQSSNPDKTYVEDIMPAKIELNMRYINHPTLFEYFKLIVLTIFKIVR